jgi:hypothetical protein
LDLSLTVRALLIKIVISIDFSTALGEIDVILDNETFDRFGYHYADAKSLDQIVCSCDFCGTVINPRAKTDIEKNKKKFDELHCCGKKECKDKMMIRRGKSSLADFSHLIMELMPINPKTKEPQKAEYILAGSNDKIYCKCKKCGYERATTAKELKRGRGCPACAGKAVNSSNCLASTHSEIAAEVFPTKEFPLTAYDVTAGSNKKINCKCKKCARQWVATAKSRTGRQSGCPACSRNVVTPWNCLAVTHPEIATEIFPTKEFPLTAHDVTAGSKEKINCKCKKCAHQWAATTNSRTGQQSGCPACSGNVVTPWNCLAAAHPEIATEIFPTKEFPLTAHDVTAGSKEKINCKCKKCAHQWVAKAFSRTNKRNPKGCPNCNRNASKGEEIVKNILENKSVSFVREWRPKGLKHKKQLSIDFAIKNNEIEIAAIEYQGIQHFRTADRSSKKNKNEEREKKKLAERQLRDQAKQNWCRDNNIPLLEIYYEWEKTKIEKEIKKFLINLGLI